MPFSSSAFDYYIGTLIDLLQPANVLDIGPGAGKYGKLIKQKDFQSSVTAVEIDSSYVEQFELADIYDEIIIDDAVNLINRPEVRFDLVIIGDCIEHMRKSAGVDLLNFLMYRSGYICIVYPERYIQDAWEGHAAEAHISTWSMADFKAWETVHRSWEGMHLFLIKGYQPSRLTITE